MAGPLLLHEAPAEQPPAHSRGPYDDLLSSPSGAQNTAGAQLARASASYTCKDERFHLDRRVYDKQYAPLYFQRLRLMTPRLHERIKQEWPGVELHPILNLPEGREVAALGTVYKDMKLKPSILDEYVKERGADQLIGRTKFTAEDDQTVLEDESARMTLRGAAVPTDDLVTGVVMAVRGAAVPGGDFHATAVLFAGMAPQVPRQVPSAKKYVALVSGLAIGEERGDPLRVALVTDYLAGLLGSAQEQADVAKIVRTVVAGGIMASTEGLAAATTHASKRQQSAALAPLREVDMCLTQLVAAMPVDVMPGPSDPANHSLPQQPLHRCLFPGASAHPTFNRVTNPHAFELEGVRMLGTSGQNVEDMYRYSTQEDRLMLLQCCLEWSHQVPTAPDTLTVYPFNTADPFIIESSPDVYFVGNQPSFGARVMEGAQNQKTLLVAVPSFAKTGVLVLIDLQTLQVHPVQFDTAL